MRGIPKHLNTKADYEYVRKHNLEGWREAWQALLDASVLWVMTEKLAVEKIGITSTSHKVIELSKTNERYQYEFKEDPNCKMCRLGFTVKEVADALAEAIPDKE